MIRLAAGLAAAALLAAPLTAQAQFNRTVIRDSGNGANNTIAVTNGPARAGFPGLPAPVALLAPPAPGGYQPDYGDPPGYGARYGGYPGAGYGGYPGAGYAGYPTPGPAFNRTVINNSGNGIGNTIVARNGGGFGYHPSGPFPFGGGGFGVNVNVVTNSGNGAGNTIHTTNRTGGPGININVITNSGNGIGNTIGLRNR
jgi:hypothetical protein